MDFLSVGLRLRRLPSDVSRAEELVFVLSEHDLRLFLNVWWGEEKTKISNVFLLQVSSWWRLNYSSIINSNRSRIYLGEWWRTKRWTRSSTICSPSSFECPRCIDSDVFAMVKRLFSSFCKRRSSFRYHFLHLFVSTLHLSRRSQTNEWIRNDGRRRWRERKTRIKKMNFSLLSSQWISFPHPFVDEEFLSSLIECFVHWFGRAAAHAVSSVDCNRRVTNVV